MMLKSFNAQKAINAAARANIPHICADPRIYKAGPFTTVPAAGVVTFSPVREKVTKERTTLRLFCHAIHHQMGYSDSGKRPPLPLAAHEPVENIRSLIPQTLCPVRFL